MNEFYKKLIEVYVGGDMPSEVEAELHRAASADPELQEDMRTMREAHDALMSMPEPEFTEESYQRILLKVYMRGGEMQTQTPTPSHLQYHLPLQG